MTQLPHEIAVALIPSYEREYKELCDNWSSLERKAQLTAGASGALLAGVVAFLGNDRFQVPAFFYLFFAVISVALFTAGLYALRTLWVSDETLPTPGGRLRDLAWELKRDDKTQWVEEFGRLADHQRVVFWDQACKDVHRSTERKGRYLRNAQFWLAVAAATAMVFVLGFAGYEACTLCRTGGV